MLSLSGKDSLNAGNRSAVGDKSKDDIDDDDDDDDDDNVVNVDGDDGDDEFQPSVRESGEK